MPEQSADHASGMSSMQKHIITPQDDPELSEPGLIQVLIFHPNHGKQPKAPPFPQTPWDEETANRQRAINLELERVQNDGAIVKDIVLGTNNFVYAVIEYPDMSELSEPELSEPELCTFVVHSKMGERAWQAEDEGHAQEQHEDAFPDETVSWIQKLIR